MGQSYYCATLSPDFLHSITLGGPTFESENAILFHKKFIRGQLLNNVNHQTYWQPRVINRLANFTNTCI